MTLTRISIRLPPAQAEALRAAAFAARLQPAVLARHLLLGAIDSGQLPPAAPPAPAALAPAARALLAALAATQSNLAQLSQHSIEIGPPLSQLATGPLAGLGDQIREIGIALKTGAPAASNSPALIAAADQINGLTRRLNQDRLAVPIAAWHGPLAALKSALTEVK